MIIFAACASGQGEVYKKEAFPSFNKVASAEDRIEFRLGDEIGICAVYNQFIELACETPDCEALVLMHEDVEILDENFRAKILMAESSDIGGIIGAVGAKKLHSSCKWWKSKILSGRVFETRQLINFGFTDPDVDVVDGLLMVVYRNVFTQLKFDQQRLPAFHGYDLDYCLQARDAGFSVRVENLSLCHRTVGGTKNHDAYLQAMQVLKEKWPQWIEPVAKTNKQQSESFLSNKYLGFKHRIKKLISADTEDTLVPDLNQNKNDISKPRVITANDIPQQLECLACGNAISLKNFHVGLGQLYSVLDCQDCGSGFTWPSPSTDISSEKLFESAYKSSRIKRRGTWLKEAELRVQWMQLYYPEGDLIELGAATGEFSKVAQDYGYEAIAIEPSQWAAQKARELHKSVFSGTLNQWSLKNPGYRAGAICLWHVLEHIHNPLGFVKDCHDVLRMGGYIFGEVPNWAAVDAKQKGIEWDCADPDEHVIQFTPEGLEQLFSRAGFEVTYLLPITRRIYQSSSVWLKSKNKAVVDRHDWPSLDFIRFIIKKPMS